MSKLKYIKYTKRELDSYVEDKESCVNLLNNDLHISFPPWGFSKFQETVTNIISRDKVGKYDTKLNGIVLDVRNIKVFGTNYVVHDDDPYNHINLNANFYVFQPHIGATITGIIKHITNRHVAAIIYRVFNVSIRFKKQLNNKLEINNKITFKIKKFDLQDGLPYIEGELIEDAFCNTKRKIVFEDEDEDDSVENGGDSGISTEENISNRPHKTKDTTKSNNRTVSSDESSSESSTGEDNAGAVNGNVFENIKIKKEKITDEENSSDSSDNETESDNKEKLHASLNKQRNNEEDDSTSSSDDDDDDRIPTAVKYIKKEKASSNEESSWDSNSDDDIPTAVKAVKKGQGANNSNSNTSLLTPVKIKKEPNSDSDDSSCDDDTPPPKKAKKQNESVKRTKNSSISESLNETTKSKSAKRRQNGVGKSASTDSELELASPVLSSTLNLSAKGSKKKSKDVSFGNKTIADLNSYQKSTPSTASSKSRKRASVGVVSAKNDKNRSKTKK